MALDANIVGSNGAIALVDPITKAVYQCFPQRRASGTLAALNAELVMDINGESSATIYLNGTGTFNATYTIQGSVDGVNYGDIAAYPLSQFCVGGAAIPVAGQPIIAEAVNAAAIQRALCFAVGNLQKIRIRLTAYTSGSGAVTINADHADSANPYVKDQKAGALTVTATGAASAAVTATLPAVAGLRHYIDRIDVTRFASALLTAGATPVLVTTTNISGSPVLSFPADAAAAGSALIQDLDAGGSGLAVTSLNTPTTVVCPVTTGVIWRVNVIYRLGL